MKKTICSILLIFLISTVFAQTATMNYSGGANYILTERTDLRRYDNGKYKGLVSREVKAFIVPEKENDTYKYDGYFYVSQDTRRAENYVFKGIHDAISSVFTVAEDGTFTMVEDCGYPSFRSFPVYPKDKEIPVGYSWTGVMTRAVDPLEKNIPTRMKSFVSYVYTGDRLYNNEEVYIVRATWATRYNQLSEDGDLYGDSALMSANGSHTADILVSKVNGRAVLIRDTVDEMFRYSDGNTIAFKGTISMFTEYPPAINYEESKAIFVEAKTNNEDAFEYEITEKGIVISLYNLNFKPDSSELIDADKHRIRILAEYLKKYSTNKILIEGHTAKAGNSINDEELSLERAHAILNDLMKYGMNSEQFICKGWGSSKPISDNSTEEGRAMNRRVEITILGSSIK